MQFSQKTNKSVEQFLANPSQALVISGPAGYGKSHISERIALGLINKPLINNSLFIRVKKADKAQNITIDEIRRLKKNLALKLSNKADQRVVLIENAHHMNNEAQNALLKSLEEPNPNTFFILTTTDLHKLLPTIVSRCVLMATRPISLAEAVKLYPKASPIELQAAWHLSGGASELLWFLVNDTTHPLKEDITKAKQFIKMNEYDRAIVLDKLSQDKTAFNSFLDALNKVFKAIYRKSVLDKNYLLSKKIIKASKLANSSQELIAQNVSPRLIAQNVSLKVKI